MHFLSLISLAWVFPILLAQQNPYCYRTYEDPCLGAEPHDYQETDFILPTLPETSTQNRNKRGATAQKQFLWPDGKVYYTLDKEYSAEEKRIIQSAMHHIENKTCVRFEEKAQSSGYVNLFPGDNGCCSYIGYIGCGKQGLSLSNACINQGTVIHELLHTMGFFHEHSRPDRDQYVRIIEENIRGNAHINFEKMGSEYINSLGIEYDYNSIMHYCENAFSVDPAKKTIITLEPNAELCDLCELSPLDILQINLLYECDMVNPPPLSTPTPPTPSIPSLSLPFPDCGEIFDGTLQGQFSSPGFSSGIYPHNKKCGWVFRAREGFKLTIKLTLSIEFTSGCTKDYMQGKYGTYTTRKYCGESIATYSKVTEVAIHMVTDFTNGPSSRIYKGITGTFTSQDINECSIGKCSHGCINTAGSYHCTCPKGLYLSTCNGKCLDVNECFEGVHECDLAVSVCKNNHGSYTCECHHGYSQLEDKKTCIREDSVKCSINNGGCSQLCSDTDEGILCSCRAGFKIDTDRTSCIDVNECQEANGGCQQLCVNTNGSFECGCAEGLKLMDNNIDCEDINECLSLPEDFYCDNICFNTFGGYFCFCGRKKGFGYGEQFKYCVDINECENNNGGCEHSCSNTVGSYECVCDPGFTLITSDGPACQDINECSSNNGGCDHKCTNTLGSYECSCDDGYKLTSDGQSCQDIDECSDNQGGCDQVCINSIGSFSCACNDGYTIHEGALCQDINECSSNNGGCDHKCTNTLGSYECSCDDGYKLTSDGQSCQDIDECSDNQGGCDQVCINSIGSFSCACNDGYTIHEGALCQDVNECLNSNGQCEQTCSNTIGSFSCSCSEGFNLVNDVSCNDIDECAQNTHGCSHNCVNTIGSFECSCPLNYILSSDLTQCVKITTTTTTIESTVVSSNPVSTVSTVLPTSTPISSTCGGLLTSESDVITADVTVNTNCTWTAKLQDQSRYFHLKIESMELEGNDESCSKCYIEIFNGGSTKGTILGKYCKAQEQLIDSAMNEVTIHYSSSGCMGSFEVSYTSEDSARNIDSCSRLILLKKESSQLVSSFGFPTLKATSSICYIYVYAPGSIIRITLLYLAESQDCAKDNLKFYTSFSISNHDSLACNPTSKVVFESNTYGVLTYTSTQASRGYLANVEII